MGVTFCCTIQREQNQRTFNINETDLQKSGNGHENTYAVKNITKCLIIVNWTGKNAFPHTVRRMVKVVKKKKGPKIRNVLKIHC